MTTTIRFGRKAALLAAATPLALALAAMPAFAQATPQTTPQTPGQVEIDDQKTDPTTTQGASDQGQGGDIVVTGSLFRRTDTETPSPVTVLTSDTLAKAGITTASDAIRSISADGAGSIGTGFQSGFSAGGSAVSLRGLGVSSTLVLVDGLRSANFPINDDGHNAYVDLNSIPFSLIDRVEVLKDGASSTYGADAIGGVVNLILKKHVVGLTGTVEAGVAEKGDGARQRANLTVGYGDYDTQGFNVYLNGEYQRDGRISNHSRGFPYNTQDLTAIGGNDLNTADQNLTTATPSAVVTRVRQTDLNNPLAGSTAALTTQFQTLNLGTCNNGTYTQTSAAVNGVGCKYDLVDQYRQIQPLQERYSANGRISVKLSDQIEGYVTGSYSRSYVSITGTPSAIRATQPFGGSPTVASSNPGIVLPVYICTGGVNCATPGTAGRQLNPNNPYAAAYANDPNNGAARIYYLFGDIPQGSDRTNEVYRAAAGLNGSFGEGWNWRAEGVYARDELEITQHGLINIAALRTAVNTGSYNFVNPSQNSQAVRDALSPDKTTPSHSTMASFDASISKALFQLPGGPLQVAVGGQVRRETLTNNNQNAALDTYGLTTSSAFGAHTVSAAYFEVDAPILPVLDVAASGRYDHYSEGFSHFSPKVGVKFTPFKQLAIRGTYSQGFRAPTFAESGARSQYAGFVTYTPPCATFGVQHGATIAANGTCNVNGNPYSQAYSLGRGVAGNPNLEPETSRSFTGGIIVQPVKWFSFTADYYNVKKSNLIVAGPLIGAAQAAYYGANNLAAAQAAVANVGPGYSVNLVDAPDPAFPNALPRVLIINVPFTNADYSITSGIDLAATATIPLDQDATFTSRVEVTHLFKYDLHTSAGVQKYAGTMGPYDLSSGNGTPSWRGNWQNTLQVGAFSLSATTYFVDKIKAVATDQGSLSTACTAALYKATTDTTGGDRFCYVKKFINVDLNGSVKVNDDFTFFVNVGNVFNAHAPVAPAAYASAPNFLTTWHYAGLVGRTFRAGASFGF
ncbi:TonB-dependent receptor [Sphingomonas sp. RP10(2022)]|uniref:TonB-dependent receptor n=1 Tax=Sphingomonas liriopis TaxID=2949094 RepID=A0A9X2HV35_9SPHN|nr:TonB-dependent receptor [Sphingomonas liriopis]